MTTTSARTSADPSASLTMLLVRVAGLGGIVVAAPALIVGGLGWLVVRGRRRVYLVTVVLAVLSWAVLWWQYTAIVATWQALVAGATAARAGVMPWLDLREPILDL